jgi:S1-C subfamily serine protease
VTREIYSLYAVVRPGNSGGPLLAPGGQVAGVVFAAATDNAHTGYALTARQVAGDAMRGESASQAVSTEGCD